MAGAAIVRSPTVFARRQNNAILEAERERITFMRLAGIVGHHEVAFEFPRQTVRLTHESIRREAFGTGAAFVLSQRAACGFCFYTFDDLLLRSMRNELPGG